MKRIVSLILCLIMAVTLLSACSAGGNTALSAEITEDGRFIYTVVRGEESSSAVESAAKDIRAVMRDNFSCKITIVKDNVVENVEGAPEVLIGNTNRPESAQALEVLTSSRQNNNYDFIIKVINNKVCIQALTDEMIKVASEWFVKTFCGSLEDWQMLSNGYEFLYQPDIKTVGNVVAGVNLGLFTVVKPVRMTYLAGNQVERFIDFYKNNGFTLSYIEEIDPEEEYEILIGDTTREESKSVTVEGDNYVIKVVGKKLVVKGGNDLALYRGTKHLADLIEESKTGEGFNWSDGYVINGKYDATEDGTYTLNFHDEFEGSNIDLSVWGDYNAQEYRPRTSSLGGTTYLSTPKNTSSGYTTAFGKEFPYKLAYQSDGSMKLAGMKIGEKDFAGATASTYHSMLYKYGYMEAAVKFPKTPLSFAIWLNGAGIDGLRTRYGDLRRSCMTEVDVIETFGSENWFASNIHRWWENYDETGKSLGSAHNSMDGVSKYNTPGNNKSVSYSKDRYGALLSDDFHTYTFYWDDECMKFALDGKRYVTYDFKDEMSVSVHKMLTYMIISAQMCEAGYGAAYKNGEHPEYCEAAIDYIRIYQTDSINSQLATSWGQWEDGGTTEIFYKDKPVTYSP